MQGAQCISACNNGTSYPYPCEWDTPQAMLRGMIYESYHVHIMIGCFGVLFQFRGFGFLQVLMYSELLVCHIDSRIFIYLKISPCQGSTSHRQENRSIYHAYY